MNNGSSVLQPEPPVKDGKKPMKLLLISDEEVPALWDYCTPDRLRDYDLILSAGDLKSQYLSFLVTMARCPLLYVHGNHDGAYDKFPPEGCECIDDSVVEINGLRIAGLGGCRRYNDGPYQYTDSEMRRRIFRLGYKIRRAGGVDIILTHAPVSGCGDMPNLTHRGFDSFIPMIEKYKPRYLVHGHVHMRYQGAAGERIHTLGSTTIINCSGRYTIEI